MYLISIHYVRFTKKTLLNTGLLQQSKKNYKHIKKKNMNKENVQLFDKIEHFKTGYKL